MTAPQWIFKCGAGARVLRLRIGLMHNERIITSGYIRLSIYNLILQEAGAVTSGQN